MLVIGLIVIVLSVIVFCLNKKSSNAQNEINKEKVKEIETYINTQNSENQSNKSNDYSKSYQRKLLFTKNEYHQFKKLQEYAQQSNLVIFPKVRLLDILEPRREAENFKTLLYKIQAKHIDFLVCDKDLRIKGIIELDDNSHDQKERQERDNFVDEILKSVGYTVVRTRYISEDTLKTFNEIN